jgi:hypothetical protein
VRIRSATDRRKQCDRSRRRRDVVLARARQARRTCPRRFGQYECGGLLDTIVLRGGATAIICPRCTRTNAGICLDCPAPVDGKVRWARRCAVCRHRAVRQCDIKYRSNNLELVRRRDREGRRARRAKAAAACRRWRQNHAPRVAAYEAARSPRRRAA